MPDVKKYSFIVYGEFTEFCKQALNDKSQDSDSIEQEILLMLSERLFKTMGIFQLDYAQAETFVNAVGDYFLKSASLMKSMEDGIDKRTAAVRLTTVGEFITLMVDEARRHPHNDLVTKVTNILDRQN